MTSRSARANGFSWRIISLACVLVAAMGVVTRLAGQVPSRTAEEPAPAEQASPPAEIPPAEPSPVTPLPPVSPEAELPAPSPPASEVVGPREELAKQLASLKGLIATIEEKQQQREKQAAALDAEIEKFRRDGFAEPGPFALSQLDAVRDQLESELLGKQITEATLAAKTDAVEASRELFDAKEAARRLAKESLQAAKGEAGKAQRQEALSLAELESEVAAATVELRRAEADSDRQSLELQQKRIDFLQEKIGRLSQHTHFSQEELGQRLAELEQLENDTRGALHGATLRQWMPEERWQEAQQQLQSATDPAAREVHVEEAEAWRLEREQIQEELLVLNRRLQLMSLVRLAWQRRFALHNQEPSPAELKLWREETELALQQLANDAQVRAAQTEQARNLLTTLQTKLETAGDASAEKVRWLTAQQRHLTDMLRTYGRSTTYIERVKRLHERLLTELNQGAESISFAQWLASGYDELLTIWNYELAVVEDRAITIKKIVTGIVIMLLGFWGASFISRLLETRLSRKNLINKDTAAVFRTLIFYSLLVFVILIAFWSVNMPVTVFTFLGGALAIGFGLGSQNLVNNFLSGLVIMTERPVRLGERIVFGNYDGMVEEVGYRCTKLRTLTGHLVTIPNSQLINDQVENVQRRPYIRRSFNLKIPYSTSRAKVYEAVESLRGILGEEGIREPIHPTIAGDYLQPRVFFNQYNDDSFNIWIIYWYSPPWFWDYMEHTERVNFRIMEEFEQLGVEFAFPTQKVFFEGEKAEFPESFGA